MTGRRKPLSRHKAQIAVVGAYECSATVAEAAESVGRAIARAGAVLVCGGLGGVMEAAARGANREGGFTLGILPGERRTAANDYIDCAVATGLGHFRNFMIAQTADAMIAIAGKYGTLSEVAMAMTLGKPVVGLGSWEIEGLIQASSPVDAVDRAIKALSRSLGVRRE